MVAQPIGSKKAVPGTVPRNPTTTPVKKPAVGVTPIKKAPIASTTAKKPITNTTVKKTAVATPKKPTVTAPTKKPAPNAQKKVTHIQPPQQQGFLTKTINGASGAISSATGAAASGIGNFTGAVVTAAGNGVAGAGKGAGSSIANTSRTWGDMVREYGNSLKDYTGAAGSRATTKGNPLGLTTSGVGAAASMASRPGVTGSSSKKGSASNPLGL